MRYAFLGLACLSGISHRPLYAQHPPTPVRLVVDTLHGTPVRDPYRWLENLSSPEVQSWFRAQGAWARATLDALPGHAALLARVREIGAAASPTVSLPREAGGRWFYTMRRASDPVARGYVRDARTGEERLLVDPAAVAGSGADANRLATFIPSPDGRLVLYGITSGGDEWVVLRVRDVATGRDVEGPFERNRWDETAWWDPGGRAFYYWQVRDPRPDAPPAERYVEVRVFRHVLGQDPRSDARLLDAAMVQQDPQLMPAFEVGSDSSVALGVLSTGDDPYAAWYTASASDVRTGTPAWKPLFALADSVISVVPHGADLYLLTRKGTPRVLRTRLAAPDLASAVTVMTGGDAILQAVSGALDGLYVQLFSNGVNRLTRIPWGGTPVAIELPPGTSIGETFWSSHVRVDARQSGALLLLSSGTAKTRPYRYNAVAGRLEALPLGTPGPYDTLDGFVTETLYAPSHDGVRVPLSIVRPSRLVRDGSMPVVLIGYGAYGITEGPSFGPDPWYESGGAIADCHVRGSGYYGEEWHRSGQKATKPNSWLDFIACAEHLVREGYTSPKRLVAAGGSAGGITVGRAITERPDLFAAAVISNGLLDQVRDWTSPLRQGNVPEFGSAESEDGFRALLAMSSYHHVRSGVAYPAVMLRIGLSDIRVAPWHSAKMIAALQAASSAHPALLRVEESGGHDSGALPADALRRRRADELAFMMSAIGLPGYRAPSR